MILLCMCRLEMMLQYGPRCIILASGTLSPLTFLESELRAPFPVKLSNPHIIGDSQLFATIVKTGAAPKNAKLTSAFNNRSNPDYLGALGEVIVSTCSVVPKGVLVFFPSYSLMDICVNSWKTSGILDKIARYKVRQTIIKGGVSVKLTPYGYVVVQHFIVLISGRVRGTQREIRI